MRRSYLPSRIEQTANPVHRFTYRFAPALVESSSARSFSPVPLFSMRIAVVGCSHGELDNIYASAQHADHEAKQKGQPGIDLLICCGDFQVRLHFRTIGRLCSQAPTVGVTTMLTRKAHSFNCLILQAMRSPPDLHAMACPPKFRRLGHFHHYYAERKRAPFLTIVIGGNHESSGYMWELSVT